MNACIPLCLFPYSLNHPISPPPYHPLLPPVKKHNHPQNTTDLIIRFSSQIRKRSRPPTPLPLSYATMSTLPEDQLKQLHEIFSRFDLDKDGSLTHLEVAALFRSLGLKPSGDQIHKLFKNMDADGSGTVEFDELVNSMSSHMMTEEILGNQNELLKIFQSFDRDGSGFITPAELAKSMTKMGQPLTYRELSEMVRDADTDGDGVISFKEFQGIMARSAADSLGFSL